MKPTIGVLGGGSFGTAICQLLVENGYPTALYARDAEKVNLVNTQHVLNGLIFDDLLVATQDLEWIATHTELIFVVIPSQSFRSVMKAIAPFLKPHHILIHCTKGLDVASETNTNLYVQDISTMSDIILQETDVCKIGCLSGPNLHGELLEKYPSATVIASPFNEVIRRGAEVLGNHRFKIYESHDMKGVELAGTLKNIMAIAAGILAGKGYGVNSQAFLISRGVAEMVSIGKVFGCTPKAFLGTAGIGDLVATCSSNLSRNYRFGYQLTQGASKEHALHEIGETVEGTRTIQIIKHLANRYKFHCLITQILYKIIFEDKPIDDAIRLLLEIPYSEDVDFI